MLLMIAVVGLYTITSLNDKYAVGKAKYNGPQLAFFMAAGTVLFLLPLLPFADTTVTANPLAAVFVLLLKYHLTYQQTANSKIFLKKVLTNAFPCDIIQNISCEEDTQRFANVSREPTVGVSR